MKWDFSKISLKKVFNKENINSISLGIIGAGIIVALVLALMSQGSFSEEVSNILSPQKAGEKAIQFINENLLVEGITASLIDTMEENGVYKIKFKVEEEEFESYVSPDGELLFVQGINLNQKEEEAPVEGELTKSDKPDVRLFTMSYCPYGLQSEKAMIPVYELLGDKADIGVYFVDYIMHGKKEIDENLVQYCIQKDQEDKYVDYLSCFTESGDSDSCLAQSGIDNGDLSSCVSATDEEYKITEKYNDQSTWLNGSYPVFDIHGYLNDQLGVSGSPTLVINGSVILSSQPQPEYAPPKYVVVPELSRTPEGYKDIICQAFNNPPEECDQTLSEDTPAPSFGGGTSNSDDGSCE